MPDAPVLVYSCEDGKPAYMHSVDAAEACRLGDYTYVRPSGAYDKENKESPEHAEARGRAMAHFMSGGLSQVANEMEANSMAPPVVAQVASDVASPRASARPSAQPRAMATHETPAPKPH